MEGSQSSEYIVILDREGFIDPRSRYGRTLLKKFNSCIDSIPACSPQERHRHWKEADGTNRVAYCMHARTAVQRIRLLD